MKHWRHSLKYDLKGGNPNRDKFIFVKRLRAKLSTIKENAVKTSLQRPLKRRNTTEIQCLEQNC